MHALARILFHVQPRNADALGHCVAGVIERGNIDPSVLRQRLVELRNLVALGQVGIKVVLAREDRMLANFTVDRRRGQHSVLHCALVQHRQRARQAKAGGANMRIRFAAESICAAAKGLGICQQLYVDLEPDDRLIPAQHFRRNARCQ